MLSGQVWPFHVRPDPTPPFSRTETGDDGYNLWSRDGIKWVEAPNDKNHDLNAVAHDASGLWVAVGDVDGTDSYLLNSLAIPIG